MKLWHIFCLSTALTAFLRFFVVPRMGKSLGRAVGFDAIRTAGQRAIAGFLASASLMVALSSLCLMAWMWWLGWSGGTVNDVAGGLHRLNRLRDLIAQGSVLWGQLAFALIVGGFILFVRKHARLQCAGALQRAREREFERVKAAYVNDELLPLPPTPATERVDRRLADVRAAIENLESDRFAGDAEAAALVEHLQQERQALRAIRAREEIERHMEPRLGPEDVDLPKPRGLLGHLETSLMSRGLLVNLNRTRRMLVFCALALLLPACLNIYLPQADGFLNERMDALRAAQASSRAAELELRAEAAHRDWQHQLAQAGPENQPVTLSAEDQDAINALAARFETQRLQTAPWTSAAPPSGSAYQLRSMVVRDQILHEAAASRPQEVAAHSSALDGARADRRMRGAVGSAEDLGLAPVPETPAGKRFAANLREYASRGGETILTRIRSEAKAFTESARLADFRSAMLKHLVSAMADGDGAYFADTAEDIRPDYRRRLHTDEVFAGDRAATAYARGEDVQKAASAESADAANLHDDLSVELQDEMRLNASRLPSPDGTARAFGATSPTLDPVMDRESLGRAADAIAELRRSSTRSPRAFVPMAESLSAYPDYFPGQIHSDEATVAAEVRRRLSQDRDHGALFAATDPPPTQPEDPHGGTSGGGGGGGGGGGKTPGGSSSGGRVTETGLGRGNPGSTRPRVDSAAARTAQVFTSTETALVRSEVALTRARSFAALRGFSRVGGVLIGQEYLQTFSPTIVDFRWEWTSDKTLRFVLKTADGVEHRSADYRASIALLALRYAADQRPTAVTMTTAEPLRELKILLHPALLDTPLGEQITALDALVDTYTDELSYEHTGKISFREDAVARVYEEDALYKIAWSARVLAARSKVADRDEYFHQAFALADGYLKDDQTRGRAARALGPSFADPARSPLAVKKEFYESALVENVKQLAASSGDLDDFIAGVRAEWEHEASSIDDVLQKVVLKTLYKGSVPNVLLEESEAWVSLPPRFIVWSGVRESPIQGRLTDILIPEGEKCPSILNFMLQVSFSSDPAFAPNSGKATEAAPWEFPGIKEKIELVMREHLNRRTNDLGRMIVADASEFAMLQRLFRCAFSGALDAKFPLERLRDLSTELAQKTPPASWHTARWNPRPGALERLAGGRLLGDIEALRKANGPQPLIDATQACVDKLQEQLDLRVEFQSELAKLLESAHPRDDKWQDSWNQAWDRHKKALQDWEAQWDPEAARLQKHAKAVTDASLKDRATAAAEETLELTAALKIRRALGVADDERWNEECRVGMRARPPS